MRDTSPSEGLRRQRISRRELIKLAGATLLVGCRPVQQVSPAVASAPTATAVVGPSSTPTDTPAPTQTPRPTRTPTPTPTPVPTLVIRRPAAVRIYPDVPSKVVRTRHAGVWTGETLVPGALRQMLDASIAALTGLTDARQAWAALFAPDERIAIKVNTIQNSLVWTHVPLVMAVAECLQQAGVPAEQIVIYDRDSAELKNASYEINEDGRGIQCSATDNRYSSGWNLGSAIRLSNILLSCHAVINMPILKSHSLCGITFAMKNHYGTFDRPESYHTGEAIMRGIAELNALPPIRERHRLVIGDVLTTCLREASTWPYWRTPTPGDAILMSFDPVAHDTIGLEMYSQLLAADGGDPTMARDKAEAWLANAAALGLGTNDASHIELAELSLS